MFWFSIVSCFIHLDNSQKRFLITLNFQRRDVVFYLLDLLLSSLRVICVRNVSNVIKTNNNIFQTLQHPPPHLISGSAGPSTC